MLEWNPDDRPPFPEGGGCTGFSAPLLLLSPFLAPAGQVALLRLEPRRSRGREETDANLSMGGAVEQLGGGGL
jgi:hypothetical protein